jgi:hypothetical protein
MKMGLETSDQKKQKPSNQYLKYSGLAFQLLGVLGFFSWLGWEADKYFEWKFPILLITFLFSSFFGMIYKLYRDIKS